jgi:hypothetical protein
LNIVDVFTFFVIFPRTTTSLQSLWFCRRQIPQHGHSWSLQYKLKCSWTKTINVNFYFNANNILQDINIMSSSPSFCGMCDNRHISRPSEAWCRECEEGLCTECTEYHSSWKLSRSHTTIPIAEYHNLPSSSLNIVDVFTFFVIFPRTTTSLQSLWVCRKQIPQHGHSCSLQYKLKCSWWTIILPS